MSLCEAAEECVASVCVCRSVCAPVPVRVCVC